MGIGKEVEVRELNSSLSLLEKAAQTVKATSSEAIPNTLQPQSTTSQLIIWDDGICSPETSGVCQVGESR